MFLKRIELAGFKSFADRTELEFVRGITAVVGPNGSGKSNISDSIRWVLGEQSAKSLRGGKMEDIIFAGSDSRKAVNVGEVSLTLDNGDHALPLDFNEVTVTRRINRSGDSEYLINKQPCRLKDITELFMDTGIGKEAYSIIGQGRIEEILSTRSEDRRGIFEEASGIVKYKTRKREAQKKLEDTEQNLLRIHDLISELEDQLEPLERQSEKAKKFKALREELKSKEISVYVHQIEQLHKSWSEASEKLQALDKDKLALSTVVSEHDAHLEKHRLEQRRLEEELDALQAELLQISEDYEKCEGQGEVLKERAKNLAANREQAEATLASQERRLQERLDEQGKLREKLQAVGGKLAGLRAELAAEEERLSAILGESPSVREDGLKADLLDKLNEIAQTRNEIRYVEQQADTLAHRAGRLEEEKARWSEQKRLLMERREELEREAAETGANIVRARDEYLAVVQEMKEKEKLYAELELTVRKWEQKLEALNSRRDTMKELQDDYDGFQHGVREVLKARGGALRGVHGAVAELVKSPAEYELAVETALGAALQNIVMDNEASAREAIAFLKKRQLGRATFLPLDVIRARQIAEPDKRNVRGMPGFVGIAADLVGFDNAYRDIVYNLLGNVIFAETLEHANKIAARLGYRNRVVTLDGDVVNAGGSMTGGSQARKNASLLGRQRMLEAMNVEIAQSERQLQALLEKAAAMKEEVGSYSERLEELRQGGERLRIREQQLLAEQNRVSGDLQQMEDQFGVQSMDVEALEREKGELAARKEQLTAAQAELAAEEAALQQEIREAEEERKRSESAKEELQAGLTDLKIRVAQAAQEEDTLREQGRRLSAEVEEARAEHDGTRQALERLAAEIARNEQEKVAQLELLNDLQLRKGKCAETIEFKRAERADWVERLEREENRTREQRQELRRIEEQYHQTEVRVNRLDVELDNLLKKLGEEYELSYELAKERYPVPEDVPGAQNEVRELKRQISLLGEVNLGAIEEFQRVSERFTFLSEQKADLVEAKTTLYQVIREIEEEMSKRFIATFEQIRVHFTDVFTRLFGGGRANLVLSEPENLLETGIDIVAQPPGKKLQNLQLLSGGERALTAIALLFAILRVKPVPFCVLDEVEAALDEANVSRFASYLREFSEGTQFIVVTHRKGTMEEADVLYGVTMEEGGVSKLVSVRLDDEAVSA